MKLLFGSFLNYLFNDLLTHIPCHWLRKCFLRLFNRKISNKAVILKHTKILNFWNIEISERVVINQYCLLDCRKYKIRIANDTDIGPYTRIWTLGHDPASPTHETAGGDVTIEDHVWIASGVTILPKLVIRSGAVVASGAVVHKTVEAMHIVGGNPAKLIKLRENPLTYKLCYTPIFE